MDWCQASEAVDMSALCAEYGVPLTLRTQVHSPRAEPMAQTCKIPITWELRQEDCKFKAGLGSSVRVCLKMKRKEAGAGGTQLSGRVFA